MIFSTDFWRIIVLYCALKLSIPHQMFMRVDESVVIRPGKPLNQFYVLFPHVSPATVAYFEVLLGLAVLHQLQQPGVAVQVQEVNLESGVMTHNGT